MEKQIYTYNINMLCNRRNAWKKRSINSQRSVCTSFSRHPREGLRQHPVHPPELIV